MITYTILIYIFLFDFISRFIFNIIYCLNYRTIRISTTTNIVYFSILWFFEKFRNNLLNQNYEYYLYLFTLITYNIIRLVLKIFLQDKIKPHAQHRYLSCICSTYSFKPTFCHTLA